MDSVLPADTAALWTPGEGYQRIIGGLTHAYTISLARAAPVRVGRRCCRPGPVAELSHFRDSTPAHWRPGSSGAGPAHARRQAGFLRHVVRQRAGQGFLPGEGLH